MKYKNIGFFEYHVEKFVLVIGLVLVLLVLWKYVLDDPYHATMRFGAMEQTIAPRDVEEYISKKADELDKLISSDEPNIEPIAVPDYTQEFRKRLVDALILPRQLPTTLGEPGIDPKWLASAPSAQQDKLVLPDPPAPYDPKVRHSFAVLDADNADNGLVQLIAERSAKGPLDFSYVSVATTFDMTQWRMKLRRGPVPRIPEEWWRARLAITGVKLERQTLDTRTGQWGPVEEVPMLPGQVTFHGMNRQFTQPESTDALRAVLEMQEEVIQPPFVPITAGDEWLPPGSIIERMTPAQRQRKDELELRINEIKADLGMTDGVQIPGAGMAPPGGEALPFIRQEDNRAAGTTQRLQSARNAAASRQTTRLRRELDDLQAELAKLMGEQPTEEVEPAAPGRGQVPQPERGGVFDPMAGDIDDMAQAQQPDVAAGDQIPPEPIQIWAHDLTVEPGKTYRYRMSVAVINPLFYRGSRLNEEQAEANQMKLSHMGSEESASEWTEPVSIAPERLYYVVDANNTGNTATVEVWRIFNGQWQYHRFTVAPGDKIGGTVPLLAGDEHQNVDMSVDAVLVDLTFSRVAGPFNSSTQSTEALLMSEENGQLFSRSVLRDDASEQRQRLLQQVRTDELATANTGRR